MIECGIAGDGFFADDDSAGMDAEVMWKVVHQQTVLANQFRHAFAYTFSVLRVFCKASISSLGRPKNFSEFTNNGFALIGAVGGEQCGMFFSIATENVGGEIVAILPAKVEIEVGRVLSEGINKSFEV
jgi:hypothetical protein